MGLSEKAASEFMKTAMDSARNHLVDYVTLIDSDFTSNWHVELIADRLEMIERGELKNLIITLPPRGSKTYLAQEMFVAWYLARNPKNKVISVGSTTRLASGFTTQARKNFENSNTKMLFNNEINKKKKATTHWETLQGGGMKSFGIQSGVSGESANCVIIDDCIRSAEEAESQLKREKVWNEFNKSISTRLLPNGAKIIINTRWHLQDLIGKIIENAEENNTLDEWEIIDLPAIAEKDEEFFLSDGRKVGRRAGEALHPDRYDVEYYEKRKKAIGVEAFLSLYQSTPITSENQTFRDSYFKHCEEKEVKSIEVSQGQPMLRLLAVDTAFSSKSSADYSAFIDMRIDRDANIYIKSWQKKIGPSDLIDELIDKQKTYNYSRIFFEGSSYDVAIQAFLQDKAKQKNVDMPIETISHNRAAKELRIRAIEPYLKNGEMYFINNWCEDLKQQLLQFPKGRDDLPDALALGVSGIKEIRRHASGEKVIASPINYSL